MTMAVAVRVIEWKPGMLPRSCALGDGRPKVQYQHRRQARRAAAFVRRVEPDVQAYRCRYGEHYHVGHRQGWLAKVEKNQRIAALERAVGL
jgi:hypothetical protein